MGSERMRKVEGYGPDWRREPFHNPRNSADSERRNSRQRQRPGQPKPRKNERTGRARGSSQFPLWKQEPMANGALIPLSSNHVASPCGIPNGVSDVVRPLLLIRTYRSCLLRLTFPRVRASYFMVTSRRFAEGATSHAGQPLRDYSRRQ